MMRVWLDVRRFIDLDSLESYSRSTQRVEKTDDTGNQNVGLRHRYVNGYALPADDAAGSDGLDGLGLEMPFVRQWTFLALLAWLLPACGSDILRPRAEPEKIPTDETVYVNVPVDTPRDICDELEILYSTCPAQPFVCPDEQAAQCILDHASAFAGYCDGGDCIDGALTESYSDYCTIRTCLGDDYDACIAAGEASCDQPTEPGVCDLIEAEAGHCPGYGYDCPAYPESQSWCFLSVLQEHSDPCFLFDSIEILCAAGMPTLEGNASCQIQECFALTTYDACYGNLEVLCPWVP